MFELANVAPWGRGYDEYRRMFALSDRDLEGRVLGCADGPASFNAEATARGQRIVSYDPLYQFSADEIRGRIEQTFANVLEQTRLNRGEFVWTDELPDVETLGRRRMAAMERFLGDFEDGKSAGRYIVGELPALPVVDDTFEIAVCSHFLFLYSGQFTEEFHVASILELCRVSRDVRIFPVLELGAQTSRHLERVMLRLRAIGRDVRLERVPYEFQRGGDQMLRVTH